jgi:hypothetical protein
MLLRLQEMAFSEGKKLLILNKGLLVLSIPEQNTIFSRFYPQKYPFMPGKASPRVYSAS